MRREAGPTSFACTSPFPEPNAKRLIWKELKKINEDFGLGGKTNESELTITFSNRSVIYVAGAHHASEIEKFRGLPLYLVYIDECQSFRAYLQGLVDDVIGPALFDYAGTLCLTGTPGPVPAGFLYQASQAQTWSHHAWTMFENPHLTAKSGMTTQQLLEREMARKGVTIDHPTIQRECFGRWVVDSDALVFKYKAEKNHFDVEPTFPRALAEHHRGGFGYDDADAIAVIGWNERAPTSFLREELIQTKQGITELAESLEKLIKKYDPIRIVMDTGGLGKRLRKKYANDLRFRSSRRRSSASTSTSNC